LPDVTQDNTSVRLADYQEQPLLVVFICNHCPFVIHLIKPLAQLANQFQKQGMGVVAISANDIQSYPQDAPDRMREFANQHGFEFPYCYDESQAVARAYGAECTPDFFAYDSQHRLRYRGQFDDSRPGNGKPVTGTDLNAALTAILTGDPVCEEQIPSIGCNIKWKS
jgi:peroxiredoxin